MQSARYMQRNFAFLSVYLYICPIKVFRARGCVWSKAFLQGTMFAESIDIDDIVKLEYASFPGRVTVIEEDGPAFEEAVAYLSQCRLLGFDTETRPCFSPLQPRSEVALLQLSGGDRAFLFRLKSLKLKHRLRKILSDPDILKVGAAVRDDIRGLQRLGQFEPAGFVDLQQIIWQWGIRDKSVKKMAAIILGVRISKTQQLSNWEAVRLSESQIKYAATDAWVCETMYLKLMESEKHPLPAETQASSAEPTPKKMAGETPKHSRRHRHKSRHRHRKHAPAGGAIPVPAMNQA